MFTSDIRGAGTDAEVSIVVFGVRGDTGERRLDNSTDNFSRGAHDTFFLPCPDIGDVTGCRIGASGKGLGSAWHLAKVSFFLEELLLFPFSPELPLCVAQWLRLWSWEAESLGGPTIDSQGGKA